MKRFISSNRLIIEKGEMIKTLSASLIKLFIASNNLRNSGLTYWLFFSLNLVSNYFFLTVVFFLITKGRLLLLLLIIFNLLVPLLILLTKSKLLSILSFR
jgi:hypothetical protein